MPVTYMSHPQHGKLTCTVAEVEANKKNGWSVMNSTEVEKPPKPILPSIEIEMSLADRYEQKFGKRPHHRMMDKTIEQKLME